MFKKILILIGLTGVLLSGLAFAGNSTVITTTTTVEKGLLNSNSQYVEPLYGMVVKFEGNDVVTNLGETKNIKPGTKFYVYRVKTFIGVVQVFEVSNWTSLARVISVEKGEKINRGDRLSDKELIFVGDEVYIKGTTIEVTTDKTTTGSNSNNVKVENVKPADNVNKSASSPYKITKVTNFEDIVKKHARFVSFKQKGPAKKTIQMPQMNFAGVPEYNPSTSAYSGNTFMSNPNGFSLMDALQLSTWINLFANRNYNNVIVSNTWPVYSSLGFAALIKMDSIKRYEKVMGMFSNANVVIVKWDESMAYELASFLAYREAETDQNKIKTVADNIIKDKKINEYLVFEVRIKSTEDGMIQFAPWNYHMYLVDSKGNRVKTNNYSPTLDNGLNKGQEAVGYVYFDKSYDTGKVKVSLENMLGADSVLTF